MDRRDFLKKAASVGALGLAGAGAAGIIGLGARKHYENLAEEDRLDRQNTHRGSALVLKKIEKKDGEAPTAAEVGYNAYAGYMIGGAGGAVMMGGSKLASALLAKGSQFYLVVKIDDREPTTMRVKRFEYNAANIGEVVPAEYVTKEGTDEIKKVTLSFQK